MLKLTGQQRHRVSEDQRIQIIALRRSGYILKDIARETEVKGYHLF